MIAGRLDFTVTLQRPTVTQGAAGEPVETWTTVATVPAGRLDARGREYFAAAARQDEAETLFTIRYRDDVKPRWRMLHAGLAWDIRSVGMVGRRDGLDLRCTATQPEDP